MKCVAVTPESTVVDQEVKFVVAPLFDGEFGVAEGHSPAIGRLGAGELRMTLNDGSVESWYVEGGFVEISNNVVSLLTNRAIAIDSLEPEAARKDLEKALALAADTPEAQKARSEAVRVARAVLRVAEKAAERAKSGRV